MNYSLSDDWAHCIAFDERSKILMDLDFSTIRPDKQIFSYRAADGAWSVALSKDINNGRLGIEHEGKAAELNRNIQIYSLQSGRHVSSYAFVSAGFARLAGVHQEAVGAVFCYAIKEIGQPATAAFVSVTQCEDSPSGIAYFCDISSPAEDGAAWPYDSFGPFWAPADCDTALSDTIEKRRPDRLKGHKIFAVPIDKETYKSVTWGDCMEDHYESIAYIESLFPKDEEMRRLDRTHLEKAAEGKRYMDEVLGRKSGVFTRLKQKLAGK